MLLTGLVINWNGCLSVMTLNTNISDLSHTEVCCWKDVQMNLLSVKKKKKKRPTQGMKSKKLCSEFRNRIIRENKSLNLLPWRQLPYVQMDVDESSIHRLAELCHERNVMLHFWKTSLPHSRSSAQQNMCE